MSRFLLAVDTASAEGLLGGIARRADDLRPVHAQAVTAFHKSESRLFARASGMKPLSPDWAERKGSTQPLVHTGALRDSLTSSSAPGSVLRSTKQELFVGSDLAASRGSERVALGILHAAGQQYPAEAGDARTRRRRGRTDTRGQLRVPKRDPVKVPVSLRRTLAELVREHLTKPL